MKIAVVDTETTGLGEEDRVVELATVVLVQAPDYAGVTDENSAQIEAAHVEGLWHKWRIELARSVLIKPTVPIHPSARATHHITDGELAEAPLADKIRPLTGETYFAAHNAAFDVRMVNQTWEGLTFPPVICTWKCAQHLYPDAPAHSNGTLRYWLPDLNKEVVAERTGFYREDGGDFSRTKFVHPMTLPPHRALPDAWVTAHVLLRMLELKSVDELVELTTTPVLLKTCHFGTHVGTPWAGVPASYLEWIVRQGQKRKDPRTGKDLGFDKDVYHTAMHYLNR